jgi:hypothetical protein
VPQPPSSRPAPGALGVALAYLALAAGACRGSSSPAPGLAMADVEALKQSIARAHEASAPPVGRASAPGTPGGSSHGIEQSHPAGSPFVQPSPRPPRDDAERIARARRAFPAGTALLDPRPVEGDGRYVFALAGAQGASHLRLVLVDVSAEEPVVVGEHDFGTPGPAAAQTTDPAPPQTTDPAAPEVTSRDAAPSPHADSGGAAAGDEHDPSLAASASDAAPGGATRISRTMEIIADGGDPVLLAAIQGGPESAACGWWLRRRGTSFVCAPAIGGASSYASADGFLVETWSAELPGKGGLDRASGASGRMLRIYGGRWREADRFQCLAWRLGDALREAGPAGVAAWQQTSVQRLIGAARRAGESLETDRAIGLLADAIAIDACTADTWRLLGRLEFERGRAVRAAPALAVGLALAPRDPGAMVDLADALAVLNATPASGAASLRETIAALDAHGTTRAIVDVARARSGASTPPPRQLARALYAAFLERTDPSDPRLESARRRAEEAIARLGDGASGSGRAQPRSAAKAKQRPAPAKKLTKK